jgi:ATP-dependent protease ClpP protease subunit
MASAIFALGAERTAAQGSRTMIHKPWVGGISGEANDLRKEAELLDSLEKDLVGVYVAATGLDADRISQLLADETWFTADEALALGLATKVDGRIKGAIPALTSTSLSTCRQTSSTTSRQNRRRAQLFLTPWRA